MVATILRKQVLDSGLKNILRSVVTEGDLLRKAQKYIQAADALTEVLRRQSYPYHDSSKIVSLDLILIDRAVTKFVASSKPEMALQTLQKFIETSKKMGEKELTDKLQKKSRRIEELLWLIATDGSGRL